MALSGSVAVKATSQNNLIFSWGAVQSIAENASDVSWQLLLQAGQFGRIDASPGSPWSATVAGKDFSGTSDLAIGNNETKVLASGQVRVSHSDTGEAEFSFSFTQAFWIHFGSEHISTVSGSGSAKLDTIARTSAPTLSAGSLELGKTLTVSTNRASTGFTHTLRYRFGSDSGVIGQGVGDSCTWTPSMELASQIPNAVSGTAVISCETYMGGTAIGTKEVTVVLTVPASVVPTASAAWEDTSGAYGKVGTLVQNISRLQVDVTGSGSYGSTPVSSAVTVSGKAYSGGVLTQAGELQLVVSVTDSRGRTGSKEYSIQVAAYTLPSLTLSASRCLEDGTADEAGDHAKITVSGFVTQVNGCNAAELQVVWDGGSETAAPDVEQIAWEKIVAADPNTTAQISATLSDKLAKAARSMVLSTGYATLDLLKGGKGIAFGKAATREGFDCAMPAYFTGPVSGVAPDGYGLGKTAGRWLSDLNGAIESGFYNFGDSTLNRPSRTSEGVVIVAARQANWLMQIACSTYDYTSGSGILAVRRCTGGTWSEWEYINPPMITGIEYRTTERWRGKAVYTKCVSFGSLPNNSQKTVSLDTLATAFIDMQGYIVNAGSTAYQPIVTGQSGALGSYVWTSISTSGTSVTIRTMADMSAYSGFVRVRYTKD